MGLPCEKDPDKLEARVLAEQALAVDPTDPRVQSTAGHVFLIWREFDRSERHFDLAQSMNPNDATLQIYWAWAQACFGRAEQGLIAAELACRLNPRHPRWYNNYIARVMFLLRNYEGTAKRFEFRMSTNPTQHPRDIAWLAAALSLMGHSDKAQQCAVWFVEGVRQVWRGDPDEGPSDYVEWLIDNAPLRRQEDEDLLRDGLRRAGLPA